MSRCGHKAGRYLVLAQRYDATATAVASLLHQRHGRAAVDLRSPEVLVTAPLWDHHVSAAGVRTTIGMRDGTLTADAPTSVIFNRITLIDPPQFRVAAAADRNYARMEMFALLLSWLNNPGCPIINKPSPTALAGGTYRPPVWQRLAQVAGFDTVGMMATSSTRRFPPGRFSVARPDMGSTSVADAEGFRVNAFSWFSERLNGAVMPLLCVGGELPRTAPVEFAQPCRRLAQMAGTELLQIDVARFTAAPSGWVFVGADACPAVTDEAGLMRVVTLLETAASVATAG